MPQGSTRWCKVMEKVEKFFEFKYADGLHSYSADSKWPLKTFFEERRLPLGD